MGKLDISNLNKKLTESYLNGLLQKSWEDGKTINEVVCTPAQKRAISQWRKPVALKRTILDKILFRTRFSDGQLKSNDYEKIQSETIYQSDFGVVKVVRK